MNFLCNNNYLIAGWLLWKKWQKSILDWWGEPLHSRLGNLGQKPQRWQNRKFPWKSCFHSSSNIWQPHPDSDQGSFQDFRAGIRIVLHQHWPLFQGKYQNLVWKVKTKTVKFLTLSLKWGWRGVRKNDILPEGWVIDMY